MKLEDYGFIGDTHTGALVGINGSIDWLCTPRFDSDACFAALLGRGEKRLLADQSHRSCRTLHSFLPRRDAGAGNHFRDGNRRGAPDRQHAAQGPLSRRGPGRRGHPRLGQSRVQAHHSLRLRHDDSVGAALRGRPDRSGGTECADPAQRRADLRRGSRHGRALQRRRGGAQIVRSHLVSLPPPGAGADQRGQVAGRDGGILARMVLALHLSRRMAHGGHALAALR